MADRNCSTTHPCVPYASCVGGLCRCESGFARDKTYPQLCRQPTCANAFCLRCFASQECMHCAQELSFLDPDNQECVTACPLGEYQLVFNGINHNKVCKQGWSSYNKDHAHKLSLSSVEIIIIVASCTLATVLFAVSVCFAVFYRRRKARRQSQAFQRAQLLNGSLPSLRSASFRQSSVNSVSASLAAQDPLFDLSRQGLSENGRETRLFLAHVAFLRPHTPVFKAMLWDLEKWLDCNKKTASAGRKLFRHRSFNGTVNPAAMNYGMSRNQLKRLVLILERYPMVNVDPHEGCRLLRWGQECLRVFLSHPPAESSVEPNDLQVSTFARLPCNTSLRVEQQKEPIMEHRPSGLPGNLMISYEDSKKCAPIQLTTFRPVVAGLEKIIEDDQDGQDSMVFVSKF